MNTLVNKRGNPKYLYLGRMNRSFEGYLDNLKYNSHLNDFDIMKCYGGPIFMHNQGYSDVEILSVEECCKKISSLYLTLIKG